MEFSTANDNNNNADDDDNNNNDNDDANDDNDNNDDDNDNYKNNDKNNDNNNRAVFRFKRTCSSYLPSSQCHAYIYTQTHTHKQTHTDVVHMGTEQTMIGKVKIEEMSQQLDEFAELLEAEQKTSKILHKVMNTLENEVMGLQVKVRRPSLSLSLHLSSSEYIN